MKYHSDTGLALRKAQVNAGLSGKDLAQKLNVCEMTVYRMRSRKDMSVSRAQQLAQLFSLSLEEFVSLGAQQ
tara:strand:- start:1790 stop:2005 length:216 start_codon:yes stop_codon:yes gene_type:complete